LYLSIFVAALLSLWRCALCNFVGLDVLRSTAADDSALAGLDEIRKTENLPLTMVFRKLAMQVRMFSKSFTTLGVNILY
jgi:hypothetical protein